MTDAQEDQAAPAASRELAANGLTVSVAICSNRPGSLHAAVASVLANETPPFELVVVAQGGDPGWAQRDLAEFLGDARLRIIYDDGRGVARSRNIALKQSSGEIVVYTDDDCLVGENWVEAHARIYREHPDVMMVFGKVVPPETYSATQGMVPTFYPDAEVGTPRLRGKIALGIGANMSVRRSLTARIGLFDEQLGPGSALQSGEEFDLSLRATAAGARVIADGRPVVIHAGGVRETGGPSRTLWQRDGFAIGALIAKQLRIRHWHGVVALTGFLGHIALTSVLRLVRRQHPSRLRMSAILLSSGARGFAAGLRQPISETGIRAIFAPAR